MNFIITPYNQGDGFFELDVPIFDPASFGKWRAGRAAAAALSYLGLGVQEPVPAWGLLLQGGAEAYATTAPWIAIFPGLAIMLTVFGINLFGDALRDVLDPKLRER
jgi:ABC-type dipeptide/oligopeptide/nickel transport system permease subunit